MMNNNTSTKILIFLFLLLVLTSVLATYYNTMVLRDFEVINDLEEEAE